MSSVVEQTPYNEYTADGVATVYPYEFQLLAAGDLVVTVNGVVIPSSDFTLSGVGVQSGGSVTFSGAPTALTTVLLKRDIALERATDYQYNGDLREATLDADLNRLWQSLQGQAAKIGGVLRLPYPEQAAELPSAAARALKALTFDAAGAPQLVAPSDGSATALAILLASITNAANGAGMVGFKNDGSVLYAAGTVGGDLLLPRPIARGGTGADNAGEALENLGLIDLAASITVNVAQTLTGTALGKCIVITDSVVPANYQVDLPAGATTGTLIMVRISRSATKLFTINGNDVPIDGQNTRVMWAGESALLLREGANWTKLSGNSRPFAGGMQRLSNQTGITAATFTQVTFTSAFGDPSGLNLAFNAGAGNLLIPRAGNYNIQGNLSLNGTSIAGATVQIALIKNTLAPAISPNAMITDVVPTGAVRFLDGVSGLFNFAAGDNAGLIGYIGAGTSLFFEFAASVIAPTLTYQEVPSW